MSDTKAPLNDPIASRKHERSFTRAAAALSEPSFAAVWDNPEDNAYDALRFDSDAGSFTDKNSPHARLSEA